MNFLKISMLWSGLITLILLVGCADTSSSKKTISEIYQPEKTISGIHQEIKFWEEKIDATKSSTTYNTQLAGAYTQLFDVTGNIEALKKSESLLKEAMGNTTLNQAGLHRSLARNYISQHRFNEALELVQQALEIGQGKAASRLMLFDIYLELGKAEEAIAQLEVTTDKKSFNYLIRKAKWEDHEGNLDQTIVLMNEAKKIAEESKNKNLLNWVYSNLGDYYGHDGQLENSKSMFQKALEISPADWYSVKGLAWIAFSSENDIETALQLLSQIEKYNQTPDLLLLKSEIARVQGQTAIAEYLEEKVAQQVAHENYGVMYNTFLVNKTLDKNEITKAKTLAMKELEVRKTPASYALLANVLAASGQLAAAQKMALEHVIAHTFEPQVLIDQLDLFSNNPQVQNQLIDQVKDARFEVGPVEYQKVEKYISKS